MPTSLRAQESSRGTDLAHHWLPNFCSWPVLVALIVIGELTALVVVLSASDVNVPR